MISYIRKHSNRYKLNIIRTARCRRRMTNWLTSSLWFNTQLTQRLKSDWQSFRRCSPARALWTSNATSTWCCKMTNFLAPITPTMSFPFIQFALNKTNRQFSLTYWRKHICRYRHNSLIYITGFALKGGPSEFHFFAFLTSKCCHTSILHLINDSWMVLKWALANSLSK